jgi:hypothetical protein
MRCSLPLVESSPYSAVGIERIRIGAVESATGDVGNFVVGELSLQTAVHCCQQFKYNNMK